MKYYKGICSFVAHITRIFPSHLEVHSHSPICSPFSNQSERHIMVSSSLLIDYDFFSLRWKGWESEMENTEIKPQSVSNLNILYYSQQLIIVWKIMEKLWIKGKHHIRKVAITKNIEVEIGPEEERQEADYLSTDKSGQIFNKNSQLTAKTAMCQRRKLRLIWFWDPFLRSLLFFFLYFYILDFFFVQCSQFFHCFYRYRS